VGDLEGHASGSRYRPDLVVYAGLGGCCTFCDTVYKLRWLEQGFAGSYGWRARMSCYECTVKMQEPFTMRCALQALAGRVAERDLVYDFCESCERKVVFDRTGIRRQRTYCSERCEKDHYNLRRRQQREAERGRDCEECGEAFVATRSDAKHCSAACKQKAYRAKRSRSGVVN
jgi:hypothetical protein